MARIVLFLDARWLATGGQWVSAPLCVNSPQAIRTAYGATTMQLRLQIVLILLVSSYVRLERALKASVILLLFFKSVRPVRHLRITNRSNNTIFLVEYLLWSLITPCRPLEQERMMATTSLSSMVYGFSSSFDRMLNLSGASILPVARAKGLSAGICQSQTWSHGSCQGQ